jgi:hypothetical protein
VKKTITAITALAVTLGAQSATKPPHWHFIELVKNRDGVVVAALYVDLANVMRDDHGTTAWEGTLTKETMLGIVNANGWIYEWTAALAPGDEETSTVLFDKVARAAQKTQKWDRIYPEVILCKTHEYLGKSKWERVTPGSYIAKVEEVACR